MIKTIFAAALTIGAALPAHAAILDDFNRPNALTLGAAYTVQEGNFRVDANRAITTSFVSLATYDGSSSSKAGVDVALRGFDEGSYVALTFGFLSGQSYFVKVQDNDGDGQFDRYGFFGGNNDLDGPFAALNSFSAGSIDVSYTGTTATLNILANGSLQTFSRDYGYVPGSTEIGLGINRLGVADNLRFDGVGAPAVPEPGTWAMLIAGFGLAGGAMRARRPNLVQA